MSRGSVTRLAIALLGVVSCATESTREEAFTRSSDLAPAIAPLDDLDTRARVPLLPMMAEHQKANMRDHLLAVQEIVVGLASEDYGAIERSAQRLGFSEQMGQTCTHMGRGAPGFTEQALLFHHTADGISAAARNRNSAAVVSALGATLKTCTTCHAGWKQHVVDEMTWQRMVDASEAP